MKNYSRQRQILKKYMCNSNQNWEDFEEILQENLERHNNDKSIKWYSTPSNEAQEIWQNFCRYHKNGK